MSVACAAPALAQMYPGQNVIVNPRAAGGGTLLYPGGRYGRNVGNLLQPGEKPNAAIRLRKPGTYRPRPAQVAKREPEPAAEPRAKTASAPPRPATPPATPPRPAPPPPAPAAPPASAARAMPPPDSAASFVPQASITEPPPQRLVSASPAPKRATPPAAGMARQSAILFNPGTTELPAETFETIRELAGTLNRGLAGGGARVQLMAYGGERGDKSSEARRLSLKRALVLRQILIEDGVPAEQIDVRAMGGADSGPVDRVDVFLKS